jgi:hypothetical protein
MLLPQSLSPDLSIAPGVPPHGTALGLLCSDVTFSDKLILTTVFKTYFQPLIPFPCLLFFFIALFIT